MKKLLITIDFPPNVGGVARYLKNICKYSKDEIVVLAPQTETDFDAKQNYKIYRKKLLFKYFWPKWLPIFWHTYKIIKKEKIQKIEISHVLPVGYAVLVFKKFLKLPYRVYTHGLDVKSPRNNPRKFRLMKKVLSGAEEIIANSEFTKKELLKIGVLEEKITLIYPCLDPDDYKTPSAEEIKKIREKYHLNNKKVLLTVGRLVARKGQDKVIEALPEILKEIPDLLYLVAGDGEYRKNLENLVKQNNLEKNVIFTGRAEDSELPALYSLSDVFIMIPRELEDGDVEGFGMVYLEANYFGKPVIGSDSGGAGEAVERGINGLLVNPEKEEEIKRAVFKIFKDEHLYKELSGEGKKRVEEKFLCK